MHMLVKGLYTYMGLYLGPRYVLVKGLPLYLSFTLPRSHACASEVASLVPELHFLDIVVQYCMQLAFYRR